MYENLAIIALFAFVYSNIAGGLERTMISGPMVFIMFGIIFGPVGLGILELDVTHVELRVVADLTLALILFIDAANANLGILKRNIKIPSRMLGIGLPFIILLGFGFGTLIFDGLTLYELAILATMLAATDAALGKAVVTNKAVPAPVREGLNAESGLNDGICVPILFVFIALAVGSNVQGSSMGLALKLVGEEIGIGLIVGLGLAASGSWFLRFCWERGWITDIWGQIPVVALSMGSFALAQSLHGSGYIAAFTGGILFGHLAKKSTHKLVFAAEGIGETMALFTWVIFGAAVVGKVFEFFTWEVVIYAVLSLTVVRMLPVYLSLTGTGTDHYSKLFLGWFGPRGLASIVFAIIVLNENLPGGKTLAITVVCTVFLSVFAHGLTANPLANTLAKKQSQS
jgi:NhaP-type Na+/H+ or K+/H+ antiporter